MMRRRPGIVTDTEHVTVPGQQRTTYVLRCARDTKDVLAAATAFGAVPCHLLRLACFDALNSGSRRGGN